MRMGWRLDPCQNILNGQETSIASISFDNNNKSSLIMRLFNYRKIYEIRCDGVFSLFFFFWLHIFYWSNHTHQILCFQPNFGFRSDLANGLQNFFFRRVFLMLYNRAFLKYKKRNLLNNLKMGIIIIYRAWQIISNIGIFCNKKN